MRVCNVSGCPAVYEGKQGRCPTHTAQADRGRGTATQRGYTGKGHRSFRAQVLERDPICTLCGLTFSTVADHYPHSKRELIDAGLNSNDPQYGRGLCKPCHDTSTASLQPGGWHGA